MTTNFIDGITVLMGVGLWEATVLLKQFAL